MKKSTVVRNRYLTRFTSKQVAQGDAVRLSATGGKSGTWESFSITVRDKEGPESYTLTFGREDAMRVVLFLQQSLNEVKP